jgi:hypothetical protein
VALLILFYFLVQGSAAQVETLADTTGSEEEVKRIVFLKNYESVTVDSFTQRKIPGTIVNELKADDDFWYANKKMVKKKRRTGTPMNQQNWFQTLLWILIIGGFAGFLVWYLAGNQVRLFSRKKQLVENQAEEEAEGENIFGINYQKEIDKATATGNYRLAIRLLFLRLLKQLADKRIIQYRQGLTNLDYLHQLSSSGLYKDFFEAARNYEYSWYGQFPVSEEAYRVIRKDFEKLDRAINY